MTDYEMIIKMYTGKKNFEIDIISDTYIETYLRDEDGLHDGVYYHFDNDGNLIDRS